MSSYSRGSWSFHCMNTKFELPHTNLQVSHFGPFSHDHSHSMLTSRASLLTLCLLPLLSLISLFLEELSLLSFMDHPSIFHSDCPSIMCQACSSGKSSEFYPLKRGGLLKTTQPRCGKGGHYIQVSLTPCSMLFMPHQAAFCSEPGNY